MAWLVAFVGVAVAVVALTTGYNPTEADIKYDWLVTREAVRAQGDAYGDLFRMASEEGLEITVNTGADVDSVTGHPRFPGALLLQLPLVVVPARFLFVLSALVSFGAAAYLTKSFGLARNYRPHWHWVFAVLLAAPLFISVRYAGQGVLVAGLGIGGWLAVNRGEERLGGTLIGLATILKIFPGVLIVPLALARRWRAVVWSVGIWGAANVAGLPLPGASMGRAFTELSSAAATWVDLPANGSLVKPLASLGVPLFVAQVVAVVGSSLLVVAAASLRSGRHRLWLRSPFVWLAAGLLSIPLSWVSYDLILLPAAILIASSANRRLHLTGLLVLGLWAAPVLVWPWIMIPTGILSTISRVLVLWVAIVFAEEFDSWSATRVDHASAHTQLNGTL